MAGEEEFGVRIAQGAQVVYRDPRTGDSSAGIVTNVDPEAELVECRNVPGVLRRKDIEAVGVYGDEARYIFDGDGTGGGRLVTEGNDV